MPIYAYKCAACAHAFDALQKVSDEPLRVCPACGAPALVKQLTAAGFQLKGSGWYATDFKNGPKPANSSKDANETSAPDAKSADAPAVAPTGAKADDSQTTAKAGDSKSPAKPDVAAPSGAAKAGGTSETAT